MDVALVEIFWMSVCMSLCLKMGGVRAQQGEVIVVVNLVGPAYMEKLLVVLHDAFVDLQNSMHFDNFFGGRRSNKKLFVVNLSFCG